MAPPAPLATLMVLSSLSVVSPNIESWQQHLLGDQTASASLSASEVWALGDTNLTECLGACLCNGALADCSHRGLESLALPSERSPVIHTL